MRQNVHADNYTEGVTQIVPVVQKFDAVVGSSKPFVVPPNEQWTVQSLTAVLTTTATVGNRQVAITAYDNFGNMLVRSSAGAVQAASLVRIYTYVPGVPREVAFVVVDELICALPDRLTLGPGWMLYVTDTAAIAPAADTLAVSFVVEKLVV